MNAVSLVDETVGFIREMIEQNEENPFRFFFLSKKTDRLNAWVPSSR